LTGDDLDRTELTFAQAEGTQPLPTPLELKQVSRALRVRLEKLFLESLMNSRTTERMYGNSYITGQWGAILYDKHVYLDEKFASQWSKDFRIHYDAVSALFQSGSYIAIFDFIQFALRHSECPFRLAEEVDEILEKTLSAYRIVDDTVIPMASAAEGHAVTQAFADLAAREFNGARRHLETAATYLNQGNWAGSVRESVHAVESSVRLIEDSKSISDALKSLRRSVHINPNLARGIEALYNYTSDESGIRHSLLEEGDAKVDEADALFMFGASAAFVSYVIRKQGLRSAVRSE
jgi:hypothetical protein